MKLFQLLFFSFISTALIGQNNIPKVLSVEKFAGTTSTRGDVNGQRLIAQFNEPIDMAITSTGVIYLAEENGSSIKTIDINGIVSDFVGSSGDVGFIDGIGSSARFNQIRGIALDGNGNIIVADKDNHAVRKVTPAGVVTTIAGSVAGFQDGSSSSALFNKPVEVLVDNGNNIYVADALNYRVRKIDTNGNVSTVVGTGTSGYLDGDVLTATLDVPTDFAIDSKGDLIIVTYHGVRRLNLTTGTLSTIVGSATATTHTDGNKDVAGFGFVNGLLLDEGDIIYVVDRHSIRHVSQDGFVTTVAGSAVQGGDSGAPLSSRFNFPRGIVKTSEGHFLVADKASHVIRRVNLDRQAPVFTSSVVTSFLENGTGSVYTAVATDASAITYSLGTDKDEGLFDIDGTSGAVTFKLAPDFEAPTDANADNVYVLEIKATDGANTSSITVQIQVANVQEFNPIFSTVPITGVNEGTDYKYEVKASDGDNAGLSINVTTKPSWMEVEPVLEVSTLSGKLPSSLVNGEANQAVFKQAQGIAFDALGNLYIADGLHHQIRKISPGGMVSTFAGSGVASFKDGPALLAGFNNPSDVAFDDAGNLFVAERDNHAIRKIDTNGNVTTVAGNGNSGLMDGKGSNGQFDLPTDITFDSSGNLFVTTSTRIKKVDQNGNVITFLGGGNGDIIKNGTIGRLRNPIGLAIDKENNLYFGESNGVITKVSSQGIAITFAGTGTPGFQDGVGTNAQLSGVDGLVLDQTGNLYFSDANNRRIRKVSPDGTVTTIAGNGNSGTENGPASNATLYGALDLALDSNGNIYINDAGIKIRRLTVEGNVEAVAGINAQLGASKDGIGKSATFGFIRRVAVNSKGDLFVSDHNAGIRKITPEGVVTTFSKGLVGAPYDILIDKNDVIYYTDALSNIIRTLSSDGTASVFIGKEGRGFKDGNSNEALFSNPYGLVIDSKGNFYVADQINNKIRKITPTGDVSTFAGDTPGFRDGNGPQALFLSPSSLAIDSEDNLYVGDRGNSRIRKIDPSGNVTTIAGNGDFKDVDGIGINASFEVVNDITFDQNGYLWIAGNNVVRRMSPTGKVTTVAGTGKAGLNDGPADQSEFSSLSGIEVSDGSIYLVDFSNYAIRKLSHLGNVLSGNTNGQAGDHNIVIEATDQHGTATKQEFTLSVFANGDFAPVFTSGLSQNFLTLTTGIVYQAIATDTKAITYQLGTSNDEALFDINATNGNLSFKTPPNFSSPQDSDNDNKYLVEVIANNGTRSTSQIVTVSVIDQIVNSKPEIISTPITSIADNTSYRYEIKTQDPENDLVTVTGSALPTWLNLEQQSLGKVTTFAGSGVSGAADGTGLAAQFNLPLGLTIDQSDNIYVAELNSRTIRRISPSGEVTTFVGATTNFTEKDGTGSDAGFSGPIGLGSDASGNLYVSDNTTSSIRKITPSGVVTTIAGTGVRGYMDGTGAAAQFSEPRDLAVDSKGNIFIADHGNDRIRKITPTGLVTTFAGSGERKLIDGVGTSAAFNRPFGITIDGSDNLYVADNNNHSIRKITPTGIVTTIAGNGVEGYVDDTGAAARFDNPAHLSSDAVGNLYVADFGNKRIRKVTVDGKVTTLAGSGVDAKTDGTGSEAAFNGLFGIVLDSKGDLFISESSSRVIRKMVISGTLPVLIGNTKGQAGSHEVTIEATDTNNGKAIQSFTVNISNTGPVFMPLPNLFLMFEENSSGTVFTAKAQDSDNIKYVLGSNFDESFFTIDQSTGVLTFKNPPDFENSLDIDKNNSYLAQVYAFDDRSNSANILVRALVSNADDQNPSFISAPITSVNDNATYEYVINVEDQDGERLQVSAESLPGWLNLESKPDGVTTTIAGSGEKKLLDGSGLSAAFSGPRDVAMDSEGNVFVVDTQNNAIRKIAVDGSITTFAGNGQQGSADGTGATATFNTPRAIAIDKDDNLYISDSGNNRIRKITKSGQVSTFAGNNGGFQDGQGTSAMFSSPRGLAIDANGVIYVADGFNSRIRTISPSGEVATLAGQGGFIYKDDTGTAAGFSFPQDVAVDDQGNVFVADWGNFSIRKIAPGGVVTTITGLPDNLGSQNHPSEDGIVASASINGPQGIVVDSEGNIYVTESRAGNVRKITPGGIVTTIAGNDIDGYADGTGTIARFNSPDGLFITPDGSLLIADASNNRIRKVSLGQTKLTGSAVGQVGDHSVSLKVNDSDGAAITQTFTITVNDVTKPVFTSVPTTSFAENGSGAAYTAVVADANTITYKLGKNREEGLFNIVSETGVVTFKDSPDFESPLDANRDNVYTVEIFANDGKNSVSQVIMISVTDVDEPVPVFSSSSTATFQENQGGVVYTAQTESSSGVEFRLSGAFFQDESNFVIDAKTGELVFKRRPDFETPRDRNGDNKYDLYIVAKSSGGETRHRLQVVVMDLVELPMGAYDVNSAIDAGNDEFLNVSEMLSVAISMEFDDEGKRLFVLGINDGRIHQFNLAVAYDVNSATYAGEQLVLPLLETQSFDARSIKFNSDGSKLFVLNSTNYRIREYDLRNPFNVANASYMGSSEDLQLSSFERSPLSFTFNNDGTKLFVVGTLSDSVHEYDLSVPYDVSSGVYDGTSGAFDFSSYTSSPGSIEFSPDGLSLFILGVDVRTILRFGLSTPFDVTTASYRGDSESLRVKNFSNVSSFLFGANGNKLFIMGSSREIIREFYLINSNSSFTSVPVTTVDQNSNYNYEVTTENSPNSPLVMIPMKPEWLSQNGAVISGLVPARSILSNDVVLVADDTKGGFIAQSFTISVIDNSVPVFVSPSNVDFISGSSEIVLKIQATDPRQVFYSLTFELPDESLFSIDAFTGDLRFKAIPEVSSPKDANADNKYELKVRAGDGENTVTQTITVHVKALDDTDPVFTSDATANFVENGTGTAYTAVATDANAITYSLGTSNDEALFDIDGSTGAVTFKNSPDFESPADGNTDNAYVLEVKANDGTNTIFQTVTITVTDVDDTDPVFTSAATASFAENGTGTAYTAVATDANAITYSLGTSNDEGLFDIDGSTGAVTFKSSPDFESPADADADNAYVLEVKANDGVNTVSQTVTITITDVDDTNPVFTSATTASFVENGTGTAYTAVATDANAITYSLGTSNDEGQFDIDGSTGAVTFKNSPDFESPADGNTDNAYVLEVKANDGTNTVSQTVTITVTDVDDTDPVFTSAMTASFVENGTGTAYTAVATDANTITYSLGTSNDEGQFDFDGSTGAVTFKNSPDFESPADGNTDNAYVLEVKASDGVNTVSQTVTITVTDVDDTDPVFTSATTASFVENGTGTAYTAVATDANTITYSLGTSNDEGLFDIDGSTGAVTFKNSPDFESPADGNTDNAYVLEVKANDGVNTVSQTVTITVTDVDDTDPVFTSAITASFVENGTGTAYTAVATDANAITYSLGTSNDEGLFDIDGSTGAVTFKSSPDFESPADGNTDNAYVLEVKASDGINIASQTVTISVTNDPEALLRVTGDLTVPNTALGLESTFDVTVHNDGDAELSITSISFPTAFIGSNLLTVAAMSSETLTITFSPTEAIVYSGDIVITTNGGVATLSVTASGEIITSIDDDKLDEKSIVLYPNPASDVLYVDLSEVLLPIRTVELVNSSGLKSHLITNPTEKIIPIDIRPLTSGVYLLRVSDGNSVVIKKVIIKR